LVLWLELCFVPTTIYNRLVNILNIDFGDGHIKNFVPLILVKQKITAFCFSLFTFHCPLVAKRKKKVKGPLNLLFASFLQLK